MSGKAAKTIPSAEQILSWLDTVCDPEIPALSVTDLGIVRNVAWVGDECVVTITPTYSGCAAYGVIEQSIRDTLTARGLARLRIVTRLAPAWTTDWMTPRGKQRLREYGIAPPAYNAIDVASIDRKAMRAPVVACPRCGSLRTDVTSWFGATACKALYKCHDCLEPFDHFKCH